MKLTYPTRRVLRDDGTTLDLDRPHTMTEIRALIGRDCDGTDQVLLMDRVHVMIVDDLSQRKSLPINVNATSLYLERCLPSVHYTIHGNVVIVPDSDFAPPELKSFYEGS